MKEKVLFTLLAAGLLTVPALRAGQNTGRITESDIKAYLYSIMPSREHVKNFIAGRQGPEQLSKNAGWMFDPDLGWIITDCVRRDGVNKSKTFYHYEPDGARRVINFPDRPCRIHTYGDSFTHCDQVNDSETWQEFLAAHLQEPVRNYGAGGYSVYQAYLRMLKVEAKSPAKYIILNIWDDDHYRNLDSWRPIRFGRVIPDDFTLPHLRVNLQKGLCRQVPNLFQKGDEVYRLCDRAFVFKTFKDDPVLQVMLSLSKGRTISPKLVNPVAVSFGIAFEPNEQTAAKKKIENMYTEAALFATENVITWTEQFCRKTGKKLMLILSFSKENIAAALTGKAAFDRSFTDRLKDKPYPVIDMRDYFVADFKHSDGNVQGYLRKYYNGHHSPAGNFFTAWAIKNKVVAWLDPKPLPYQN